MKNILVTGATRGLGLAISKKLVRLGYQVLATGRRLTPELETLIGNIDAQSGKIRFYPFDLANTAEIHNFVRKILRENGHLYGLVNNAALGHDGVLATMHDSQISDLLNVNVMASILIAKYSVRSMLLNQEGRVINIASIIASTGFSGLSVYAASKAALIGFTKSLAREIGRANITVNAIAPGYMETNMTKSIQGKTLESIIRRSPLNKLPSVDDVAGVAAFLMSDEAKNITGIAITVDAGSSA